MVMSNKYFFNGWLNMKKIIIIYGELSNGVQKKAIEVLSELLLDYTNSYTACYKYGDKYDLSDCVPVYIGTKSNNAYIKLNSQKQLSHSEEYSISVKNNTVIIEGNDDSGVLYGCIDFYNNYLVKNEYPHDDRYRINPIDFDFPDYEYSSYPSVSDRGIWTWGHVIYDYRGFFDNMTKLKMNTVIIWNDYVPVNAHEMVEYAHDCGIKVIWGFSWLWDVDCLKVDINNINSYSCDIFKKYEREYASLGGDGIYFQSFTELRTDTINGVLIADAVTDFVNNTARHFYEKYPDIELQFGLHATSVKEKLDYIKNVNPKIRIVWEDCGAFPFSYIPNDISEFDETMDFTKSISLLRGNNDKFGVVTKGFTKLDWFNFEHTEGTLNVGISSKHKKRSLIERKRKIWKYIQAYWLINADKAYDAVKLMSKLKNGNLCITALVEDGMFEENIMYPVALYSEMMWNTNENIKDMMAEVALRDFVDFA